MLSKVKKKIITPRACVMKCVFAPDEKKNMNMNLCNSFSPELNITIKKGLKTKFWHIDTSISLCIYR